MRKFFLLLTVLLPALTGTGQEVISGLEGNPVLQSKWRSAQTRIKQKDLAISVVLPFLDDFSYNSVYPTPSLWSDKFAFVNTGYAPNPPSVGVATLDAVDDTGAMYSNASITPFIADYLTSLPIRLDSLFNGPPTKITAADSLYFSFYYQPQGYGNNPNPEDSLVLEFYVPSDSSWKHVWAAPGMTLSDFRSKYGDYFKQVLIPITDTAYFKENFMFRFKNFASITTGNLASWQSNMDQWNIDYVYLNANRKKGDTVFADVAYVDAAPAILRDYWQMPASQFSNSELKDTMYLKMTNLNSVLNNIHCKYTIKQLGGAYTYTKDGGVGDIYPYITHGYHNYHYHTRPAIDFSLPSLTGDSTVFEITNYFSPDGWKDSIPENDTIRYYQRFYNYYAYDNGTAEAGYGLAGMDSQLAYKFTLNHPDTLSAIQFYFNPTLSSPSQRYFYLMVWSSLDPETVLYKSVKKVRPVFTDSLNKFCTFKLDSMLLLSGTFYIGWQQKTDDNLNVGYDWSRNSRDKIFYNTEGSWEMTAYDGSLMMRPVLGAAGFQKIRKNGLISNTFTCNILPNPVSRGYIEFELPEKYNTDENRQNITVEIFDFTGRRSLIAPFDDKLDISMLNKGVYFVRLTNFYSNETITKKLVITG